MGKTPIFAFCGLKTGYFCFAGISSDVWKCKIIENSELQWSFYNLASPCLSSLTHLELASGKNTIHIAWKCAQSIQLMFLLVLELTALIQHWSVARYTIWPVHASAALPGLARWENSWNLSITQAVWIYNGITVPDACIRNQILRLWHVFSIWPVHTLSCAVCRPNWPDGKTALSSFESVLRMFSWCFYRF